MEIEKLSVKEILELLDSNKVTSVDLVNAYFDRIDKYEDNIGAFVTLTKDYALDRAKKADEERKNGSKKALLGVPIAIKDNICTKGIKTTCASRMLEDFVPPYSATVIEKIEKYFNALYKNLIFDKIDIEQIINRYKNNPIRT